MNAGERCDDLVATVTGWQHLTAAQLADLTHDYSYRAELAGRCHRLADRARAGAPDALRRLHRTLDVVYGHDFASVPISEVGHERLPLLRDVAAVLEEAAVGRETDRIGEEQISGYPTTGRAFVHWLKARVNDHPAATHPLYDRYMADHATRDDIRLLLAQETSLDPRFDDILAQMQTGRSGAEKLELAANYWDEMGNGDAALVHTSMFQQALDSVGVDQGYIDEHVTAETLVCGNLSACLSLNRRHYYKAVGYFGVTEYLAPRRFRRVVDAWRRLGLDEVGITYHDLHIGIDAGHASGWFRNVIVPLVEADPRVGREVALGATIRLNTSQDYLDAVADRLMSRSATASVLLATS